LYNEEEFVNDEYITDNNDPNRVEKITEEDYTIPEGEGEVDFDEIFESVRVKITNLTDYDYMMNEKVLDSLRRGKMRSDPNTRFWSKVDKTESCWNWLGCLYKNGYGIFRLNGKNIRAHRLSYEKIHGKIPKGLQLDHLCRNRKCVNPDHLEAVTQQENIRRGLTGILNNHQLKKTHCPQGHDYNKENTSVSFRTGYRQCRICCKIRQRKKGDFR